MRLPLLIDDPLLLLGQDDSEPGHGETPGERTSSRRTSRCETDRQDNRILGSGKEFTPPRIEYRSPLRYEAEFPHQRGPTLGRDLVEVPGPDGTLKPGRVGAEMVPVRQPRERAVGPHRRGPPPRRRYTSPRSRTGGRGCPG